MLKNILRAKRILFRRAALVTMVQIVFVLSGSALFMSLPASALTSNTCQNNSKGHCNPATQNNPAGSASDASCLSNQKAVQITSGKNKGKWYCKAKPNNGGNNGGKNGNNGNNGGNAGVPTNNNNSGSSAQSSAAISKQCGGDFFGLVPWYNYLGPEFSYSASSVSKGLHNPPDQDCTVKCFNIFTQSQANDCGVTHSDIPYVLLAIVDDLLRVAGIVAVVFVIVGAFNYVGSQGNPDSTAKAQNTITGALIGMALAIVSVAFISYLGSRL